MTNTLERNNLDLPSVNHTLMSIMNFINTFKSLIDYYCNKKDPSIFRIGSLDLGEYMLSEFGYTSKI